MLRPTLLLVLMTACATTPRGPAEVELGERYGDRQGLRAAQADLLESKERLDMFLGIPAEVQEGEEPRFVEVLYCVARNHVEEPLEDAERLINHEAQDPTRPMTVWCDPPARTYLLRGVDCDAKAIKVWHPKARKYVIIELDWTVPFWRMQNIKRALRRAAEKGLETGRDAILP